MAGELEGNDIHEEDSRDDRISKDAECKFVPAGDINYESCVS